MMSDHPTPTPPALQEWHVSEPYLHIGCALAEGPFYEAATGSLRFVDIKKGRVHWVRLSEGPGSLTTVQLDGPVTVTSDIEGVDPRERILVGLKHGLAVLDRATGGYEYVARFFPPSSSSSSSSSSSAEGEGEGKEKKKEEEEPGSRLRSNDGAADPHGRFWLGSMTDIGLDLRPEGHLHLFTPGRAHATSVRHPVTIPNAVGWSPDQRTMYFTHSTERTVYAWDYDGATGDPDNNNGGTQQQQQQKRPLFSNERVFYRHRGPGEPDGFRVDAAGNLWHAVYGEGVVLKISPGGALVGQVRLPTRNVTCTQFVGPDLFVTTAAMGPGDGGTDEEVALGGAVFRVDVGARGLDPFAFRLLQ
ncbi:putative SMP-30 Gluconolaconase LRE-like region [Rosellinia necatrix]|uniref:Putative SMP-30 Gluconolaconase LRE-like region n=1 Tax=Rosellinia necatrix TaxID=77044 RepID=A0A1W2TRM8_ROSNE|nr:putative SMP-30 Gluconolaconase LRE-like region [Rosellinia necatrix]